MAWGRTCYCHFALAQSQFEMPRKYPKQLWGLAEPDNQPEQSKQNSEEGKRQEQADFPGGQPGKKAKADRREDKGQLGQEVCLPVGRIDLDPNRTLTQVETAKAWQRQKPSLCPLEPGVYPAGATAEQASKPAKPSDR